MDPTFTTLESQQDGPQDIVIPACSRRSFSLGEYVTDYDVSTTVVSNGGGVVVERAMYGGRVASGLTTPSATPRR